MFGREADKLEHSNDDESTYYLMEKEPLVNRFISVPRDKGSLNCAVFVAGIIEAVLTGTGFVSFDLFLNFTTWYMIFKFNLWNIQNKIKFYSIMFSFSIL